MTDYQTTLTQMTMLVEQWETVHDRRAIFLGCYRLMTRNMLDAIEAGRFHDGDWVSRLLERFAGYYFAALQCFEQDRPNTPPVWKLAFDAAGDEDVATLQHLLLGVNAHINFDLVFSLYDLLQAEWAELTQEQREQRHADHTRVNHIIGETTDMVQDHIIERFSPWANLLDKLLGPVDEWLTSQLLTSWREEVWDNAVRYLELIDAGTRAELRRQIEQSALERGSVMLKIK
jgi:hypothetical protein